MEKFNLKNKRKKIIEASKPFIDNKLLENIFHNIELQDKEFIKRLKEEIVLWNGTHLDNSLNAINKLAGDKLNGKV